jgi:hypothetical protein
VVIDKSVDPAGWMHPVHGCIGMVIGKARLMHLGLNIRTGASGPKLKKNWRFFAYLHLNCLLTVFPMRSMNKTLKTMSFLSKSGMAVRGISISLRLAPILLQ